MVLFCWEIIRKQVWHLDGKVLDARVSAFFAVRKRRVKFTGRWRAREFFYQCSTISHKLEIKSVKTRVVVLSTNLWKCWVVSNFDFNSSIRTLRVKRGVVLLTLIFFFLTHTHFLLIRFGHYRIERRVFVIKKGLLIIDFLLVIPT